MPDAVKVIGGLGATDGPVFSRRGYLLFSDVPARRIMKWEGGQLTAFRTDSNGASGLTFDHEGRLLACESNRVTRTEKDGIITVLADRVEPHDVVYAIDGNIYVTASSGVHQITPQGPVRIVSRDCKQPGGVALSPNQQRLYVSDSGTLKIFIYDIAANGSLGKGRILASLNQPPLSGLKTSEDGAVWVAGGRGIVTFDAAGAQTSVIPVPERTTNCGWGDGFRDLYVTAGTSVYRIAAKISGTRTY